LTKGTGVIEYERVMAKPNQAFDKLVDLAEHLQGAVPHVVDDENSFGSLRHS